MPSSRSPTRLRRAATGRVFTIGEIAVVPSWTNRSPHPPHRGRTAAPSITARSTRSGWRSSMANTTEPPYERPTTCARRADTRASISWAMKVRRLPERERRPGGCCARSRGGPVPGSETFRPADRGARATSARLGPHRGRIRRRATLACPTRARRRRRGEMFRVVRARAPARSASLKGKRSAHPSPSPRIDRRDDAEPVLHRLRGIEAQVLAVARTDHLHRLGKTAVDADGKSHCRKPKGVDGERHAHARWIVCDATRPSSRSVPTSNGVLGGDRGERSMDISLRTRPRLEAGTAGHEALHRREWIRTRRRLRERGHEPLRVAGGRMTSCPRAHGPRGVEHVEEPSSRRRRSTAARPHRYVARILESPGRIPYAVPHLRRDAPARRDPSTSAARIGVAGSEPRSGAGTVHGSRHVGPAMTSKLGPQVGDPPSHRPIDGHEL